ncbi:hypothetical protein [Escherichia coli]|uniref:hypothetical protein n=1 Tax=Escherichia coli TaxID=562 RepID=UPI0020227055|nr:hypothetical protein [Escherichia coli]
MSNGMAVVQAEKAANVPLSPEMKQFQAAKHQGGGITFDGMKAWRAKFADAEQANTRAGKANAARIAGEMRRAITDDMRIMAEKETSSQNGRKLTISLKVTLSPNKMPNLFLVEISHQTLW